MKGRPIDDTEFQVLLRTVTEVVGEQAAESWTYVLRGLWESALRIEELMHVSWDKPGTIRPVWTDGQHPVLDIPADMQKNGTHETIPALPGFEQLLLETPVENRSGWIFNPQSLQGKLGRRVRHQRPTSEWVGRVISKIGKAAGIIVVEGDEATGKPQKFVSAHDLRRSCSKRLRYAGVPPLVISRVMRHSSWETTQKHYAASDVQMDGDIIWEILGDAKSEPSK
ncbi:site-specific integrase [Rubinisphaera sp. JC750]|uniref:site-specific integrase n=1 Tax=Rubinisphaera sp. JC750 TaxID=2898658 RepID=UPI001F23C6F0|nr:site-specific integrase [Rubinisphaera sp. JC750]